MGRRDSTVALALADVAKARAELGELAEAEQLFREALDNQRARSQGDHATVKTLVGLGEVLIRPCPSPATSACGKPAAKHLAIQRARRRLAVTQGQQPATAGHSSGDH